MFKCPLCQTRFPEELTDTHKKCPGCGTLAGPVPADELITLTIEWEHLRLITNLALNALPPEAMNDAGFKATLDFLLESFSAKRPPKGSALTMEEEFDEFLHNDAAIEEMLVEAAVRERGGPVDTTGPIELPTGKKVYLN